MIAVAMIMMPAQTNGLNQLPRKYYPHGSAIINTLVQVGGAIGIALFISILASGQARYLSSVADTTANIEAAALTAGVQSTFSIGLIFAILAFILTLFIKRTVAPEEVIEQ